MTKKLKEVVDREIGRLQKDRQDAINSFDWTKTAEDIGKIDSLSESEVEDLQIQILFVLTGLTDTDQLANGIVDEIAVTEETAKKISTEVFQKIFTPIGKTLIENVKKKIQGKDLGWRESLGFVLSGGDYSIFIRKDDKKSGDEEKAKTTTLDTSRRVEDIKNSFTI